MKEIFENVKLSFALLTIRILDIGMFVGSAIGAPFFIGAIYLCGKCHIDSWFFKFMDVVYSDGIGPNEAVHDLIEDIGNSENVDENEA